MSDSERLQKAIEALAAELEYGHLIASMGAAAFLESAADEIRELKADLAAAELLLGEIQSGAEQVNQDLAQAAEAEKKGELALKALDLAVSWIVDEAIDTEGSVCPLIDGKACHCPAANEEECYGRIRDWYLEQAGQDSAKEAEPCKQA